MMLHTSSDAGPTPTSIEPAPVPAPAPEPIPAPVPDPTPAPTPAPEPSPSTDFSQLRALALAASAKADAVAKSVTVLQAEIDAVQVQPPATPSPWNDFLGRLLSRKFLIALLAQVPVILAWVTSSIPGQTGAILVSAINLVYIVVEGVIDTKGQTVAAALSTMGVAPQRRY